MATKPNKAKSKRRQPSKSKARRIRSKPLLAEVAQVRTGPRRKTRKDVPGVAAAFSYNPALTMIGMMGRLVGVYAELPGRLVQCRSPMDLWLEQARFTQRVFSEWQPKATR